VREPVDVLALAAHPDDAEVGCGATLLLAAKAGARTAIADLTAGEASTHGTPELRARERDRASALLGLTERVTLDLPDTAVGTDPAHRDAVVALLRELRPRVVLAPYPRDRHPDHAATGRLAREACFLSGVQRFSSGEPHAPERLYHYMLHEPFAPTFVLDVGPVWEQSRSVLAAYASQFGRSVADRATPIAGHEFLDMLAARATVHGAFIGADRGEPFYCTGPLAVSALPGLEVPRPSGPPRYRAIC
jgi:bacillithiol biosynthesis deacetylase BshB1